MMNNNINKTVLFVCVALFGAILAQEQKEAFQLFTTNQSTFGQNTTSASGNHSATNQSCHESYDVTLIYYRGNGKTDINNVTLTRLSCGSAHSINFTIGIQNITILDNEENSTAFREMAADRFLIKQNIFTHNIIIVPRGTFTPEQESILGGFIKNFVMIVRNQTGNGNMTDSYLNATIVNDRMLSNVRLYPGWTGQLSTPVNQTMVFGGNSTMKTQNVTVIPGWYDDETNNSIRLLIRNKEGTQYVTVLLLNRQPEDQNPSSAEARYIHVNLNPYDFQMFAVETVLLFPGWKGVLKSPITQTLVPGDRNGTLKQQTVIVYPKWSVFVDNEGVRATAFKNAVESEHVSIFFGEGKALLKSEQPIYMNATIVPQFNQTFKTETVMLYPGWKTILSHKINQTMIVSRNSQFVTQNVTVAPGWYLMNGNEAVRANVELDKATDYVTIFFTNQTFNNVTRNANQVQQMKLF